MEDLAGEKFYKSAWHLLIALVGAYELRESKTKFSKVLSVGLIAFHADAAICDALGKPTLAQRFFRSLKPEVQRHGRHGKKKENTRSRPRRQR
jgi:hypothetical protein